MGYFIFLSLQLRLLNLIYTLYTSQEHIPIFISHISSTLWPHAAIGSPIGQWRRRALGQTYSMASS